MTEPSVGEGVIRDDDEGLAARESIELAQRFDVATRALAQARMAFTALMIACLSHSQDTFAKPTDRASG